MEEKNIDTCLVERYQKNGDTYKKLAEFEYTYQPSEDTEMITKPEPVNGRLHTGFDGLLLRQYERWYNEEVDKNRLLRTELDQTARELAKCKNELHLFELKKSLEFQQRDFQQERKAKQGLDGIMDTLEKTPFCKGF